MMWRDLIRLPTVHQYWPLDLAKNVWPRSVAREHTGEASVGGGGFGGGLW
jgi:hypothetical protein